MDILDFIQYSFIQKAFIAGSFIAITCAVLGLFLVLRKMSLIGDGLSHVSFGAIALGLFAGLYPFAVAVPIVMIGAWLMLMVSEKTRMYGDAAIGIISAIGIAGGVILASVSSGFNIDLFSYLFGNILAVSTTEVIMAICLSIIVLIVVRFFYWDLCCATFDEDYAKTAGIKTHMLSMILAFLTAIIVILSIKVVGVMLVSALLILPAVTALQIAKDLTTALRASIIYALSAVMIGITVSFFADLPTGATIIMTASFFFVLTILYKKILQS